MNNVIKTLIKSCSLVSLVLCLIMPAYADNELSAIATLRDTTEIDTQKTPNRIPKVVNKDVKKRRSYPMQPPVIPHKIRNYQVTKDNNKCFSCHSRVRTEESQAPMISVTHYMDREGNFLGDVSPRRYFCDQCHVKQLDVTPLVENQFVDMHSLMKQKAQATK